MILKSSVYLQSKLMLMLIGNSSGHQAILTSTTARFTIISVYAITLRDLRSLKLNLLLFFFFFHFV